MAKFKFEFIFLVSVSAGNYVMQQKFEHGTVRWCNGPNQETEASTHFLHFVLFWMYGYYKFEDQLFLL